MDIKTNRLCIVGMMNRLKWAFPGLTISALAGAIGSYFFYMNFWVAALITELALIANGVIADWEDRGNFND